MFKPCHISASVVTVSEFGILIEGSEVYKTEPQWTCHYIPPNVKNLLSALICCDAWERCSSPALGFHSNSVKQLKPWSLGLNFYFSIWVMLQQLEKTVKQRTTTDHYLQILDYTKLLGNMERQSMKCVLSWQEPPRRGGWRPGETAAQGLHYFHVLVKLTEFHPRFIHFPHSKLMLLIKQGILWMHI